MDPRSEVVLRQLHNLNGDVLFIHAPADTLLSELPEHLNTSIWTWNFADHQAYQRHTYRSHFGIHFPDVNVNQVVIFVPKSKELLSYVLHQVMSHVDLQTQVFLVGEKKGGVERAAKQLREYGKTTKLDSARHCQMWLLNVEKVEKPLPISHWIKQYQFDFNGQPITVMALPGVFSQDHLDKGTAVLLPFLQQVKHGQLADFGCGAGVISCCLAKSHPNNTIFALDVDAFALQSTALSLEHNGIPTTQFSVQAVTGIQDAPQNLDAIISNPPFHQGVHTHYAVSENLCAQSVGHLKSNGELWIVANRFLNYPLLIEKYMGSCSIRADQEGFKVLYAQAN
ncbi:MAG: class I SAM-dependent methyltransferase [Acinetobacter sp.]